MDVIIELIIPPVHDSASDSFNPLLLISSERILTFDIVRKITHDLFHPAVSIYIFDNLNH